MAVDRAFARAYVVRAAVVWAVFRAVASVGRRTDPANTFGGGPASAPEAFALAPSALLFLYVMVIAAVLLDARRRKEHQFLANLGISGREVAVLVALVVTVLEVALYLTLRSFGP